MEEWSGKASGEQKLPPDPQQAQPAPNAATNTPQKKNYTHLGEAFVDDTAD